MFKRFSAFDEIPGELQARALELKDGGFVVPEESDNTALEKTVSKLREENKELQRQSAQARDTAAELQRKLDTFDATGKQSEEKIAQLLTKWEADKKAAVEAAVAEAVKPYLPLQEQLTKYQLDDVLSEAFIKSGGREERKARALVIAKQEGWSLVDGKVVRKDASGEVTTMSPDDYFAKAFRTELPEFYKGTQGTGGGAAGVRGGAPSGIADKPPTQWSSEERAKYITEHGPQAYSKLLNEELVAKATAPVSK